MYNKENRTKSFKYLYFFLLLTNISQLKDKGLLPGTDEQTVAILGDEFEVIHDTIVAQKLHYIFGTCKSENKEDYK